jgi:mono/diheme cytochrome c family protein
MRSTASHPTTGRRGKLVDRRRLIVLSSTVLLVAASLAMPLRVHAADSHAVARGKYLVTVGSCTDCHTPGSFFGKPDMSKYLGGSDVGFAIPHLGVFVGPNLTSDKATGLGNWTETQIVNAITKGQTPQGRMLAPVMPWHGYANLTASDALAIAAYLKSLPAVSHQVAGPFGPNETPTTFVMAVIPGAVYAKLASPPPPASPPPAATQMAPPAASPASAAPAK